MTQNSRKVFYKITTKKDINYNLEIIEHRDKSTSPFVLYWFIFMMKIFVL